LAWKTTVEINGIDELIVFDDWVLIELVCGLGVTASFVAGPDNQKLWCDSDNDFECIMEGVCKNCPVKRIDEPER
jgi:hypothetical protein